MNAATETQPAAIHLQGVGLHTAILVADIKPGTVLVWNTGATTEVVAVVRLSAKFVNVIQRSFTMNHRGEVSADRHFHSRRMKLDRLAGYSPRLTAKVSA
jgi:hypothetical protein